MATDNYNDKIRGIPFRTLIVIASWSMVVYQLHWCVRGYHVYRDEWDEELECVRKKNNLKDPYSVAVMCDSVIVGHRPRKISRICALFMKRRGTIHCEVVGKHSHSADR